MSCACERLGPLQRPAHVIHSSIEERLRAVSRLATRYRQALHPVKAPDPQSQLLIEETRIRLSLIHRAASKYLPGPVDKAQLPERLFTSQERIQDSSIPNQERER